MSEVFASFVAGIFCGVIALIFLAALFSPTYSANTDALARHCYLMGASLTSEVAQDYLELERNSMTEAEEESISERVEYNCDIGASIVDKIGGE